MKQIDIKYNISGLKPIITEDMFDTHFNKIYRNHINDYNLSINIPFNKAGAYLHELYFENIREYRGNNIPVGKSNHIIDTRYGSYQNFVKTLTDQTAKLEGSGWIYMNSAGYLNIIPNNRIVKDICMIIDLWEHSYYTTYRNNRYNYVVDHLHLIDWSVVNDRINNRKNTNEDE